jgi:hypothetical protein
MEVLLSLTLNHDTGLFIDRELKYAVNEEEFRQSCSAIPLIARLKRSALAG